MYDRETYSTKPEVAKDTSSLPSHDTPVLDLCESCVTVHLRELELGLRADSLRERCVSDDVAQRLSVSCQ